jgi:molecular chaperone IbpA
MRTNEFTPFLRAAVGFDRLFSALESASRTAEGFPPFDIEDVGDERYRITLAVAGFSDGELEVVAERGSLTVKGKPPAEEAGRNYLRRGIARRAFERNFVLADRIEVERAALANGLLVIDLKKVVPEEDKPRQVAITAA